MLLYQSATVERVQNTQEVLLLLMNALAQIDEHILRIIQVCLGMVCLVLAWAWTQLFWDCLTLTSEATMPPSQEEANRWIADRLDKLRRKGYTFNPHRIIDILTEKLGRLTTWPDTNPQYFAWAMGVLVLLNLTIGLLLNSSPQEIKSPFVVIGSWLSFGLVHGGKQVWHWLERWPRMQKLKACLLRGHSQIWIELLLWLGLGIGIEKSLDMALGAGVALGLWVGQGYC